jgi:prepilin-type N-terminal cleavage/methylation domain-containing protein/prepilin-type processing-associated H-X9-DG protein
MRVTSQTARRKGHRFRALGTPSRAFTLLELLVVVALLAVLAAMLLPVLAKSREQAHRTVCLARLRQIGQGYLLYLQDWDERFPDWRVTVPATRRRPGFALYWTEALEPYLKSRQVLRDPSAVESPRWREETLAQYALYTWGPDGAGTAASPYWRWPGPPLALKEVRRPSETLCLGDGLTTRLFTSGEPLRHGGGGNGFLLDGHARWLSFAAMQEAESDGRGFYWHRYAAVDR